MSLHALYGCVLLAALGFLCCDCGYSWGPRSRKRFEKRGGYLGGLVINYSKGCPINGTAVELKWYAGTRGSFNIVFLRPVLELNDSTIYRALDVVGATTGLASGSTKINSEGLLEGDMMALMCPDQVPFTYAENRDCTRTEPELYKGSTLYADGELVGKEHEFLHLKTRTCRTYSYEVTVEEPRPPEPDIMTTESTTLSSTTPADTKKSNSLLVPILVPVLLVVVGGSLLTLRYCIVTKSKSKTRPAQPNQTASANTTASRTDQQQNRPPVTSQAGQVYPNSTYPQPNTHQAPHQNQPYGYQTSPYDQSPYPPYNGHPTPYGFTGPMAGQYPPTASQHQIAPGQYQYPPPMSEVPAPLPTAYPPPTVPPMAHPDPALGPNAGQGGSMGDSPGGALEKQGHGPEVVDSVPPPSYGVLYKPDHRF